MIIFTSLISHRVLNHLWSYLIVSYHTSSQFISLHSPYWFIYWFIIHFINVDFSQSNRVHWYLFTFFVQLIILFDCFLFLEINVLFIHSSFKMFSLFKTFFDIFWTVKYIQGLMCGNKFLIQHQVCWQSEAFSFWHFSFQYFHQSNAVLFHTSFWFYPGSTFPIPIKPSEWDVIEWSQTAH